MKGIVFTGGELPDLDIIRPWIEPWSFVVAADSGLVGAERAGLVPDLVIGDMDSLPDLSLLDKYPAEKKQLCPRDKDLSDTELALSVLVAKGIDNIVLVGGNGGRMDHFFALRLLFEREKVPSLWIGGESAVIAIGPGTVSSGVAVTGISGEDPLSIFGAGPGTHACRSRGFHWLPDTVAWDSGAFSLSNRSDTDRIQLHTTSGRFLLVVPFRKGITVERLNAERVI